MKTKDTPKIDLVSTRHPALIDYLREQGLATGHVMVSSHCTAKDVEDRNVLGILPHHLSSKAASITEIPMRLTPEDRQAMQAGDLTLERTREVAGDPVTYKVIQISDPRSPALAMHAAIEYCEGYHGVVDGPLGPAWKMPDTWRGLSVMYFISMCGQFSVAVILCRGIWTKMRGGPGRDVWLDGLGQSVDVDGVEPAADWLWKLKGIGGFEAAKVHAKLLFESKPQAWAAAERILHGHPSADGPQGVAELVMPVPATDVEIEAWRKAF